MTIRDIPKTIPGIDEVEVLIIDDGSTDETVRVAEELGVNHIIRMTNNKGLAEAFMLGFDACLRLGADIIVNTDGDNQYSGKDIEKLVQPIIHGQADIVIGARDIKNIRHFSLIKRKLQSLGSWVVRRLSGTSIPDVTSGFRAYSKEAAMRMNIVSKFTYTLETVIQAGKKNIALTHVPVRTNEKLRESRLFSSIYSYLKQSMTTIVRIYTMYEPLKTFFLMGSILLLMGVILGFRYLYFYFFTPMGGSGHIQSVILAAVFIIVGFQILMIGLLADLISDNRRLIEDSLYRIKRLELGSTSEHKK